LLKFESRCLQVQSLSPSLLMLQMS
jgi:hypothetical protein